MTTTACRAKDPEKCPYHGAIILMEKARAEGRVDDFFTFRAAVEDMEKNGFDESDPTKQLEELRRKLALPLNPLSQTVPLEKTLALEEAVAGAEDPEYDASAEPRVRRTLDEWGAGTTANRQFSDEEYDILADINSMEVDDAPLSEEDYDTLAEINSYKVDPEPTVADEDRVALDALRQKLASSSTPEKHDASLEALREKLFGRS